MRKATLEQFVEKAKLVHGEDRYCYSKVDMQSRKVTLVCNRCSNEFNMSRDKHLMGQGCSPCRRSDGKKYKLQEWVELFTKKHGSKFDYSRLSLDSDKITVGCPVHGWIETTLSRHLHSSGCRQCGIMNKGLDNKITTEYFIAKSEAHHKGRYDYSLVDMSKVIGVMSKVPIICKTHGVFEQLAGDHMQGCGCRYCAPYGYNSDTTGSLYVLSSNAYTKIGITNRDVPHRLKQLNAGAHSQEFEIVHAIKFSDGAVPRALESKLLKHFRESYSQPTTKFDGSTECFINLSTDTVLQKIVEFCSEHYSTK